MTGFRETTFDRAMRTALSVYAMTGGHRLMEESVGPALGTKEKMRVEEKEG